ncbi:MAG: hypothetical protein IT542_07935 [Rubellimicrobium sp.]|nr:hypothetical protein [Rubellimicrobium sp.]
MKGERRWIRSTLAAAETSKVRMPWERGLRRAAMIARRKEQAAPPQRRSA